MKPDKYCRNLFFILIDKKNYNQQFINYFLIFLTKGQLISGHICGVLNFQKMQRNIARISALVSKMGQIKKVKAHYHPNLV